MGGLSEGEVLVITGPTASGKTRLALELASRDPSIEIVNADAQLLYRGFDIGTAKPSLAERAKVPHHIIDVLDPSQRFSAADYSKLARETIRTILQRGKTPVVVGGTGFYIDALFFGIVQLDVSPEDDERSRERAKREIEEFGFDEMHNRLKELDPVLYAQIEREKNPLRLYRAWEYYYATGIPLGEARKTKPEAFEIKPRFQVLEVPRPELRERIEKRIDVMLANGWVREVETLLASGVTPEMPAMKSIGYRELTRVVGGELPLEEARVEIIHRTRQYAKRQETWMRRYKIA
jgi:tRNA dimethylallyltransferase